MTSAFAKVY